MSTGTDTKTSQLNAIPVLMYHQIADQMRAPSRLAVSPDAFAGQLRHLQAGGYTTLTAADLATALAGGASALPAKPVVLTFDDGYADFHSRALPLLRQHGFTATLFVTTGWIRDAGPDAAGNPLGRTLTWSQIAELASAGVEIGAHSHAHPELDQLSGPSLRHELARSKELLEDRLGMAVPGLAYPFGYSNAAVRDVTAGAGYAYACAVANTTVRPPADRLALPRLTVRRSTGPQAFDQMAAGQVPLSFVKDWSLTKGWSVVRRTRAALGGNHGG
jgi:peptidoglycan/xylan/chitin deacetylase (PgdA/CDA1 family)